MEQILATPIQTAINPYEKLAQQEPAVNAGLEQALEQILATTQYPTTYAKLNPPIDTTTPVDQQKDIEKIEKVSDEEMISTEQKDSANLIDKATSIVTDVISSITSVLPIRVHEDETEETVAVDEKPITPVVTSSDEKKPTENIEQEQILSIASVDITKSSKTDIDESEESKPSVTKDHLTQTTQPVTEIEQKKEITFTVPNYFTSSDVYHAYKQPMGVLIPQKDESALMEKATSLVNDIISSATSILPTTTTAKEPTIADKETDVEGELSPQGLVEIMKNLLPNSLRPIKSDDSTSEEPNAFTDDGQDSMSSSMTGTTVRSISEEDLTRMNQVRTESPLKEEISSPAVGYFTSSDVYHAYKQPFEPFIEEKDTSSLTERATSMVSDILSSVANVLPTLKSTEETITSDTKELPDTSSTVPSAMIPDEKPSEEILNSQQDIKTLASDQKVTISSFVPGYFTSSDVYHAYKQPAEPTVTKDQVNDEEQLSTASLVEIMKNLLPKSLRPTTSDTNTSEELGSLTEDDQDSMSSSITGTTVRTISEEDLTRMTQSSKDETSQLVSDNLSGSEIHRENEQLLESRMETPVTVETIDRKKPVDSDVTSSTMDDIHSSMNTSISDEYSDQSRITTTESTISEDQTLAPTIIEKETIVSKPSEESTLKTTTATKDISESVSSTGLLDIMKSFLPMTNRPTTTTRRSSQEQSATVDENKETTSTSKDSEEQLLESSAPSVVQTSEHDTTSSQIPTEKGETELGHEDITSEEQELVVEKHSTGVMSKLTSVVTGAITAVQHILPTASESVETDISESKIDASELSAKEHHGIIDFVVETASNVKEKLSHLAMFEDESTSSKLSNEIPEESFQSTTDTNEKVISTEEEQLSEILSTNQLTNVESDQLDTSSDITSVSEEIKPHYQYTKRVPQPLQVLSDEYPWYASYYTIADADANMGVLYKRLSRTLEQLEQRPPQTTVQFEPEPHEIAETPDYDRQALIDTRDTREKVHELAQMSTKLSPSNIIQETEEEEEDDNVFEVIKRRKNIPASIIQEKPASPSTTPKNKSALSPDNDQVSVVPHDLSNVTHTTTATGSKKKHKKSKKDKKDTTTLDSSIPSTPDVDEQKAELIPSSTKVERTESVEPKQVSSSATVDSIQIEQPSTESRNEFEQQQQTVSSSKQKTLDERSEEPQAEPLSSSMNFDAEEFKFLDDEKNDSTSSDASQWSTSSFIMVSDEQAMDKQVPEKSVTITSPIHESTKSEITASSSPSTKKKKVKKQQSSEKEISQQSKVSSSPVILEAPKVESKPPLPTPPAVRTKIIAKSKNEQEEIDEDDEGFQVVTYRKRVASVTGPEKGSPSSSAPATPPTKQRFSSTTDIRSSAIANRQTSSIPVLTPIIPKQKKDKQDIISSSIPATSSSTDIDSISSSVDTYRSKQMEQQKKTDDVMQQKSLFSTLLTTSSSSPSLSTEEKPKQQTKDQEISLQSQIEPLSVSTTEISKVPSKPISPSHTKSTTKTTLRAKASTSPDDDDDDDEGFQVVRHRKRILSAPRSDKTLPSVPTSASYRQNLGRNIDLKTVVIRGRHGSDSGSGSGSRSAPRSNVGGQMSSDKRQQNRPKRDRPQMLPLSSSRSSVSKTTQIQPTSIMESKQTEQPSIPSLSEQRQKLSDTTLQSSVTEQTWKPIGQLPWTSTEIQHQPKTNESDIVPLPMKSTFIDENQSKQQKSNTNTLQKSAVVSFPVEKSNEQQIPSKIAVQPAPPVKQSLLSTSTKTPATETRKAVLADDEDEDDEGFRVVRYRKHASSATTTPSFPKPFTLGSDVDKRPAKVPKKQHSLPSTPASTPTTIQTMTFKRAPLKSKRSGDQSSDVFSSSATDTDLVPLMKEEYTRPKPIEQAPKSQLISEPVSSPRSEQTGSTRITTTKETVTKDKTKSIQKLRDDSDDKIQSTTSPIVTSADTSDEQSKKSKKKHKRTKLETAGSELSTPSEEISRPIDRISPATPVSTVQQSETSVTAIPSTATEQINEKSDRVILKQEETSPFTSIDSSKNVEDEQDTAAPTKKPAKKRKKKVHATDKQDLEEGAVDASTPSTTDKESSSTEATTPNKHSSFDSSVADRAIPNDDKQESEWIDVSNRNQKSKSIEPSKPIETYEQQTTFDSQLSSEPLKSDIMSDNINDIQFKAQNNEEQQKPTESDRSQSTLISSAEQQLATDEEPITEQIATLSPKNDTETETELSTKLIESSETSGDTYLDAYRDQTGRLRRKKPRKHTRSSDKHEDVSSTLETQTSEEHSFDRKSISEHWADVLATPISPIDDEQKFTSELIEEDQIYEDEDSSKTSSKLDSFLPEYIRQQIRSTSSSRSLSFAEHRSKSSSVEPSTTSTTIQSNTAQQLLPVTSSNQSTSADTSENEGQKQKKRSFEEKSYSMDDSQLTSSINLTEDNTSINSSSSSPSDSIRKKKQRPKMLKKDVEAKTLLTHEFDDTPFSITEVRQILPVTQSEDDDNKDQSFLSSIRDQFDSVVSTISDAYSAAVSSSKATSNEEQETIHSDEPVPSTQDFSNTSSKTSSDATITATSTTTKKSSTRSPRKRSKRDSGPDYESLTLQSSIDSDQSLTGTKSTSTSREKDQLDSNQQETQKPQLRQRTSSGRQTSNTEEENEQAILADDEEDKKPFHRSSRSSTRISTTPDSSVPATPDIISTSENKTESEPVHSSVHTTSDVTSTENSASNEQPTTTNEQLRVVQGFHSFTPNKYQYNQYEEGLAIPNEQIKPTTTTTTTTKTESEDTVLSRGFSRWLQQGNDITTSPSTSQTPSPPPPPPPTPQPQPSSPSSSSLKTKDSSAMGSGLTRAMQSLIIQPVESDLDDDDEDEEDSWNGPRAKRPTYATGIRTEKRIHTASAYNINHPRSTTLPPSWLISSSTDNTYQDDHSKLDPDDEDDSLDDTSEKHTTSKKIDTQLSSRDERQTHLNNLADLTFQPTTNNISSSSSPALSSAVKWNETSIRSDDNNQQQTNFTEDDVQRCLGEDFYRESLAVDTIQNERRTISGLEDLVLKPTQSLDEIDDEENNNEDDANNNYQQNRNNNNNNNRSNTFDEWAHFLERQTSPHLFLPSVPTTSMATQDLSSTDKCSYARVLDDETLVSDKDRTNLMEHVQYSFETERQRYGDFAPLHDISSVPQPIIDHTLSSTTEQPLSPRQKPSETFQRWRNQVSQQPDVLPSNSSNLTSTDATNDDEIFISHSDGGLSRRVRPST